MASKNQITIHAFISGKVQGVYFRDYTKHQAQSLQLTGWVKNLVDGRVETMASGPRQQVMDFVEWLQQGSPNAKVEKVCWEQIPMQTFIDFKIILD